MTQPNDPQGNPASPPPLPPGYAHGHPPPQYATHGYPQQQAPHAVLPYATPLAAAVPQPGYPAWRDGHKLITPTFAVLPPQCVKCGAPAEGHYLQRTFWWFHPALYLLIFAGVLIFAIVALIVRKKAVVHLGLCAEHQSRRRNAVAGAWLFGLGGLATLIGGFYVMAEYRNDAAPMIGTLAALGLWIVAMLFARNAAYLTPTSIDNQYAYFNGAGPAFLDLFPSVR